MVAVEIIRNDTGCPILKSLYFVYVFLCGMTPKWIGNNQYDTESKNSRHRARILEEWYDLVVVKQRDYS